MPRIEHVTIAAPDGIRLAATLYLPEGDGPWPALLEALPYRKDDITAVVPARVRPVRRGRLRRVPRRRARHGLERGHRHRRVPGDRAHRPGRRHRLARDPAVVDAAPSGCSARATAASTRSSSRPSGRRRSKAIVSIFASDDRYRRRRPLLRRRAEGTRRRRLPDVHGGDERAAAGAVGLRRRLARGVGAAGRGRRAVGLHLAASIRPTTTTGAYGARARTSGASRRRR